MKQKKLFISLLLMCLTLNLVTACGTNNSVTQGKNDNNQKTDSVANADDRRDDTNMSTPIQDQSDLDADEPDGPLPDDTTDIGNNVHDNSALDDIEEAIDSTTEGVTDAAKDVAGGVKDTVDDLADGAKNTMDDLTDSNNNKTKQ